MARARNIKPGFFKNYELADLGAHAQILFAGLWCLADKEGRLEDKPRLIKAEVFPYYEVDVNGELTKLNESGFVKRYTAFGQAIIQICNFNKHQSPHSTEKPSSLPAEVSEECALSPESAPALSHENNETLTVDSRKSNGGNPPDSLIHRFTDSLIPEDGGDIAAGAATPPCPFEKLVAAYHELMPLNPRVKVMNDKRKASMRARWVEASHLECKPFGYKTQAEGVEAWRTFFATCAESKFLTGRAKPQPGKPPFFADLEFLMSPSGFANCLENKYHRDAE